MPEPFDLFCLVSIARLEVILAERISPQGVERRGWIYGLFLFSKKRCGVADTVNASSTSFVGSGVTAALELILTARLSPRQQAKAVRGSISRLGSDKNKRWGIADTVHALFTPFICSAVTAALEILNTACDYDRGDTRRRCEVRYLVFFVTKNVYVSQTLFLRCLHLLFIRRWPQH